MSYIKTLITQATNIKLNLENNRKGNYSITPQHGINCFVYHIYKLDKKGYENHLFTITISYGSIVYNKILVNYTTETNKIEIEQVRSTLKKIYLSVDLIIKEI